MNRTIAFLATTAVCITSSVQADYIVWNRGGWPGTWPEELEPLREQARTLEGPQIPLLHYQIPFKTREQFEAAWPHLLKVVSDGAPLILRKSPYTRLGRIEAGVLIHTPPRQSDGQARPEAINMKNYRLKSIYIELIVDGKIVDLNRIELPADTPILDKRFEEQQTPSINPNGN